MSVRATSSGHQSRNRPPKIYRGSRKRLREIGLRGNWSVELWIFVAVIILGLLFLVPLLVRHPPRS
jgi:hypothetical protein